MTTIPTQTISTISGNGGDTLEIKLTMTELIVVSAVGGGVGLLLIVVVLVVCIVLVVRVSRRNKRV